VNKISKKQLMEMIELQDTFNSKVNTDWRTAGYDWDLYIIAEAVEACGHLGFKHWKKDAVSVAQYEMELVDIFHFLLSRVMVFLPNDKAVNFISELIDDSVLLTDTNVKTVSTIKSLIFYVLNQDFGFITVFAGLVEDTELGWQGLYDKYILKNALNHFRNENGYTDGTYKKIRDNREDNEIIIEMANILKTAKVFSYENIMAAMKLEYEHGIDAGLDMFFDIIEGDENPEVNF